MEDDRKVEFAGQRNKTGMSYTVLQTSKKNNTATIADLWKINKVLKKVTSKESKMFYGRIGKKEEQQIVGISVASFKTDEKAIGGVVLLLVNQDITRASPIY